MARPRPVVGNTYRAYENPAYHGQRRVKMWSYLIPPTGPNDPTWTERARQYWGRQMDLYGVTFTAFWLEIDPEQQIVKTFAVVGVVLDGRRETHHAEEMAGVRTVQ